MNEHICVLGLGYIGLPTSIMFVSQGCMVTGVDVNNHVIEKLQKGNLHIHEVGLAEEFQKALNTGLFNFSQIPVYADIFIIAVPTPFKNDKKADMSYVLSAANSIVPVLRPGNMVILESTSPPRTTIDLIKPILEEGGLICGDDFDLVYSPERVLPGKILEELVSNDRVVGGVTKIATERAKQIYAKFVKGEIHSTDSTTAEMVKLMENTYRDVNIALANEFSRIAHEQRINVWEAIELANHHPRVNILSPGPGVGGHCISVDPWFLVEVSPTVANLIRQARIVNDEQPAYLIKLIKEHLPFLEHKKVAALGLSYKPDIDDLRESPAIEFAKLLAKEGAEVYAYEPFVPGYEVGDGVRTCFNLRDALHGAELIVILVAHQQFKEMDYAELLELSDENAIILDAVNVFQSRGDTDSSRLIKMGWGL